MGSPIAANMRGVPQIVIAQHVIDKMVRGALLYPEPETGEAMVGLIVPREGHAEPAIYILDTISPGERAVREWGMFEQGDDWQADVFNWMDANWEAFRELRRSSYGSAQAAKWDTPLRHVGDWHKQPGDMTEPSGGDLQTAQRMIADPETNVECLVAPIVTIAPLADDVTPLATMIREAAGEDQREAEESAETVAGDDLLPKVALSDQPQAIVERLTDEGWSVRIDFWYLSKQLKQFVPVKPEIWPDDRLPGVSPVAWHLAHPRRFDQEYDLLTEAGYAIDVVRFDADGRPPYEICFSVYKPGSTQVFLLVTSVDYPASQPAVRMAPLVHVAEDEDVFEKLYEASEPVLMVTMPEWSWDSKRTLVELVWHVERHYQRKQTP